MQSRLAIAVVFVVGCVAGGAASQMVVPKARAGTNPQRWEYFCIDADELDVHLMNRSGADGWELVSVVATKLNHPVAGMSNNFEAAGFDACFKRPAP